MPEHKAFQRYFNKFDIPTTNVVFGSLYRWFLDSLKFDNFTLDIDSTVITRYGEQNGAKKGYNKHKPGRKSQHPIIAARTESKCSNTTMDWTKRTNPDSMEQKPPCF
jgi:hypothetical protein